MEKRLPWNHPDLAVASDPPLRSRYRLLQSWYRDVVLDADYGQYRGRPVGSLLSEEHVRRNPSANFHRLPVVAFVDETAARVLREGGALDPSRLRHNMLSSMPLCFNVFGALRADPQVPRLLGDAFDLPVGTVHTVVCEWAPPRELHMGDHTAFDAFVSFTSTDGESCFLAVETKYTEPFSPKVYDGKAYRDLTGSCGWFRDGASDALKPALTNQLWRNVLLAASLMRSGEYDRGWAGVLTLEADRRAARARETLTDNLVQGDDHVRWCSYEQLVAAAARLPSLREWADWFRTRYLDLAPLGSKSTYRS